LQKIEKGPAQETVASRATSAADINI
jgi:hypothetical protein